MYLSPAQPSDHASIVTLVNLAYRGNESTTSWSTEARDIAGPRLTLNRLQQDLAPYETSPMLVARAHAGSQIIGTVWLESDPSHTWHLGLLAITPNLQNQKLGRTLLEDAEALARTHGAQRIQITVVNTRTTLLSWYQRRGYLPTGATEPYPTDHELGRPLHENLHFIVMEKPLL